jgi:hypothetical protein
MTTAADHTFLCLQQALQDVKFGSVLQLQKEKALTLAAVDRDMEPA